MSLGHSIEESGEAELVAGAAAEFRHYLRIARPDHWIKNVSWFPAPRWRWSSCRTSRHRPWPSQSGQSAVSACLLPAAFDGRGVQRSSPAAQGQSLFRCVDRVDQQPHPVPVGLVHCGGQVPAALERTAGILDGRRIPYVGQALLRIPLDRGSSLAGRYRRSFARYTESSLLLSAFFYALCSSFLIAVFLIKYRVEFILTFPLFAILSGWYLSIGLKQDSAAQAPEKLYQEKAFLCFAAFTFVVSGLVLLVDLRLLGWMVEPRLIRLSF